MINLIFWAYIFLDILGIIVIVDVLLSWLWVFQIQFRPQFIAAILDPIYGFVRKNISTILWPFDFTALIVMFCLIFCKGLLLTLFPEISDLLQLYTNM